MYDLSVDPLALVQYGAAVAYYTTYHPGQPSNRLPELMYEAFATARNHPHALPLAGTDSRAGQLRRVNVWHFAFLYRVDEPAGQLVIERIFHERTGAP